MSGIWANRLRRAIRRPPTELFYHGVLEFKALKDRFRTSPISTSAEESLPPIFGVKNITELWDNVAAQPFFLQTKLEKPNIFMEELKAEVDRITRASDEAMAFISDFLGSGKTSHKANLNWHLDSKNNVVWPLDFFRDIDVLDKGRKSDIKMPWELSRLQWLTPVAQCYMLNGDESYAQFVKDVLVNWIDANPYGRGPNWAVTIEAAMRIYTWTWLFHIFHASKAWSEPSYKSKLLGALYEHGLFCDRYLEKVGHNGNHLVADAGALVLLGEFFPYGNETSNWCERGWSILVSEIFRQVLDDGTDFEGSTSYHRMVAELFLWPALYRRVKGKGIPELYYERLRLMGAFTSAYTKPDGTAPLWGDADDGRPYIFGPQRISDHSYLPALISLALDEEVKMVPNSEASKELYWALGWDKGRKAEAAPKKSLISQSFGNGGVYVMAGENNHIFIDCGPVGFGGRGGHGHNDCLSFEAVLKNIPLITDSGSYVYTEDFNWRNSFRSTSFHNTPRIDQAEINRFIGEDELFLLSDDAKPKLHSWKTGPEKDIFIGSHSGYERLGIGLRPVRTIVLDKMVHGLVVQDEFEGDGIHQITIPFHFVAGATLSKKNDYQWHLSVGQNKFDLQIFELGEWKVEIGSGWVSESYGIKTERAVLVFTHEGPLASLTVGIRPDIKGSQKIDTWMKNILAEL